MGTVSLVSPCGYPPLPNVNVDAHRSFDVAPDAALVQLPPHTARECGTFIHAASLFPFRAVVADVRRARFIIPACVLAITCRGREPRSPVVPRKRPHLGLMGGTAGTSPDISA